MVAVGPNEFAFSEDPLTRISFKVDGKSVTGVHLARPDGSSADVPRQ
jgi:hypothetical protein